MRIKKNAYIIVKYIPILLISDIVFYSCGRQVSVSPPDSPPPNGYVYITSYPRGFDIYLDGKDRRRMTPDSITWLSTGTYTITLKKDLFRDSTLTINIKEGKKKNIYVDFSKNLMMLGSISCQSYPQDAEIFLNDSSTGKHTPTTIYNILPGNYNVTYHLKNHQDVSQIVPISSDKNSSLDLTMIDTTIWNYYTTENSGIKTNDLTCVAVDKNDVVWVGTEYRGVLSFDGSTWGGTQIYAHLPDAHINCIGVDKNNLKIFGTPHGYTTYDDIKAQKTGCPTCGPDVQSIAFDHENNWYLGTRNWGLEAAILENGIRHYQIYDSSKVPDYWIPAVFVDNSSNLWVGTRNWGIAKRNSNGKWERFFTLNRSINNNYIRAFAQDPSENLWVGFGTGDVSGGELAIFDGINWQYSYVIPTNSQTNAIFIDKNNVKWIATDKGLFKFSQGSEVINLNYKNTGININNVTGIAQDSKGNLWFSAFGVGLVEYKGNH